MAELDETFMRLAQNNKKEEFQKQAEFIRKSEKLNNKKIVSKRKKIKADVLIVYATLIAAGVLAIGYFNTKSQMQGAIVEPRTGFTTMSEEGVSPDFGDVVTEMFNKGK